MAPLLERKGETIVFSGRFVRGKRMDLSDRATYHGPNFEQRKKPNEVFYEKPYELNTAVLFIQNPSLQALYNKVPPDKILHLDRLRLEKLKVEILNYKETLEEKGVDVFLKEFERFLPNIFYASDTFFSFAGDVYIASMATELRRMEEPFVYKFFHKLHMNPKDIFDGGDVMESSDLLYLKGQGFFIGKGARTNGRAIKTIKENFSEPVKIIELPGDVQHLMGVIRVLSEKCVAIRHQKISDAALSKFSAIFEEVLKIDENDEVMKKQAFNVVPYQERKIIMPDDCPEMQTYYENHDIDVETVKAREVRKGGGGLACVTGRLQ